MKNIDKIKYTFITVFTAINGFLGSLAMPFYLLVLTNILDYLTGIWAAVYRGERVSSDVGFQQTGAVFDAAQQNSGLLPEDIVRQLSQCVLFRLEQSMANLIDDASHVVLFGQKRAQLLFLD